MNQVAQFQNEAALTGERLPDPPANNAEIRDLAVLVFDMADQIQKMIHARRRGLEFKVTNARTRLRRRGVQHGAE